MPASNRSQLLRPELPEDALYGLPGRVALTLADQTGADPASILTMFLTAFGNAIGRQPHIWFGGATQSPNLFTLIVGEWARGRKGTAWGAVKRLMLDADPDWAGYNIESGIQSPEAIVDSLHDEIRDLDPRFMILEAEFARLIQAMERARNFGAELRKAYDSEPLSRRKAGKVQRSSQHHISLLGMITPGELIHLSKLVGGLESRMLYVYSAPAKQAKRVDPFRRDDAASSLASDIRNALDYTVDYIMNSTDPISAELAAMRSVPPTSEFYVEEGVWQETGVEDRLDELNDAIGEDYARYTVRGPTHVIRLALLYALTDQSAEIRAEHLNAAVALWEFCAWSARRIFSVPANPEPRVNPRKASQVFDYLLEISPEWASKTELSNEVLSKNSKGSELDVIVTDLLDQGIIEIRTIKAKGRGRPRVEYRAKIN